jgi:hypothetical protein
MPKLSTTVSIPIIGRVKVILATLIVVGSEHYGTLKLYSKKSPAVFLVLNATVDRQNVANDDVQPH